MFPIWPELVPADKAPCDALGVISFGHPLTVASLTIPVRQLGAPPLAEVWHSSFPVKYSRCGDVSFASNGVVLLGTVAAHQGDLEAVTARLYEQIIDTSRRTGYPHLLRVWNHVGAINEDECELERYKRFSKGRHDALTRLGYAREQFPAASAVGMKCEGVAAYFIASRTAGAQVENPRQIAAYDYPPVHGPRSPSFSRATVARWNGSALIFVSGTASIVGYETRHEGDVEGQLDETLRNIESIVAEAASRTGLRATLDDLSVAKVYIRRACDYERIAPRLSAAMPRTQILFVESDICRRDLLVEIEGVVTVSPRPS